MIIKMTSSAQDTLRCQLRMANLERHNRRVEEMRRQTQKKRLPTLEERCRELEHRALNDMCTSQEYDERGFPRHSISAADRRERMSQAVDKMEARFSSIRLPAILS